MDALNAPNIAAMLDVLAEAQAALHAARIESGIEELEEQVAEMKKTISAAVLEYGQPVKGSVLQAVINKGRVSWDGKLLEGYAVAHPEILAARKEGEPTVTIRAVK